MAQRSPNSNLLGPISHLDPQIAAWQNIAASIARRCGLKPQGLCDVHCLGLALCDTTSLNLCCAWPLETNS